MPIDLDKNGIEIKMGYFPVIGFIIFFISYLLFTLGYIILDFVYLLKPIGYDMILFWIKIWMNIYAFVFLIVFLYHFIKKKKIK